MNQVRTRFAPSPTGFVHVGNIRTALYAWLVARQANGQFILRLEDTDKNREVAGSEQHIIESLKALGLNYDEGPDIGGKYGPYRQSERLDIYTQWGQKLIDLGKAYADPYTSHQVQKFRDHAKATNKPFLYRHHRPEKPPIWDGSQPLRFKSDPKKYKWHDLILGDLSTGPEVIDDYILIKSDGYATYNFAHIIDDREMRISHVIRGQEFISSVPNYLNLYESLEFTPPIFATVPFILGADGRQKMSKRDGSKDVMDYIKEGFLPDALINFIASLGWNDGSTQEIFSRQELINKFNLEKVHRSSAHFDDRRLLWMNGHFIREMSFKDLTARAEPYWPSGADKFDETYKMEILGLVQERLKYLAELAELTKFFFVDLPPNPELIKNNKKLSALSIAECKNLLVQARAVLNACEFKIDDLTNCLNELLETTKQSAGVLFSLIRIATTQAPSSPGLAETLSVLGKQRSINRLDQQIAALNPG
ncbi:MAG TPA: glutamate--tRNA ligase [Candidatus Saccharimonadales bacterium]|nr:glutamate--tRNA ligase [Candidatus Saccharimonadales bacterium]